MVTATTKKMDMYGEVMAKPGAKVKVTVSDALDVWSFMTCYRPKVYLSIQSLSFAPLSSLISAPSISPTTMEPLMLTPV